MCLKQQALKGILRSFYGINSKAIVTTFGDRGRYHVCLMSWLPAITGQAHVFRNMRLLALDFNELCSVYPDLTFELQSRTSDRVGTHFQLRRGLKWDENEQVEAFCALLDALHIKFTRTSVDMCRLPEPRSSPHISTITIKSSPDKDQWPEREPTIDNFST
jgi:hypothetical protein